MTTKKERADALAHMTKAELVRTVVKLDRQVAGNAASNTRLLNRIAELETERNDFRQAMMENATQELAQLAAENREQGEALQDVLDRHRTGNTFPWEQK